MQSLTPKETATLERIEHDPMLAQVQTWAAVNSGSGNLTGLGTTAGLLADGFAARESRYVTHQLFDQAAMMAPVTRACGVGAAEARRVLTAAMGAPRGPGYLELAGDAARA